MGKKQTKASTKQAAKQLKSPKKKQVAAAAPQPEAPGPGAPEGSTAPTIPTTPASLPKKFSALDAAAKVLAEAAAPMKAKEIIAAMSSRGLWSSPAGKTPEATLYSAMIREIRLKGKAARFTKVDRGAFALA